MEDNKTTSLRWGAGMGLVGFIGIILFVLSSNTMPLVSTIQFLVGQQVTLPFLQFMSVLTMLLGIFLFYYGAKLA